MDKFEYQLYWNDLEMEQQAYARKLVREGKAQIKTYTYPDSFGRPVPVSFYVGTIYP